MEKNLAKTAANRKSCVRMIRILLNAIENIGKLTVTSRGFWRPCGTNRFLFSLCVLIVSNLLDARIYPIQAIILLCNAHIN